MKTTLLIAVLLLSGCSTTRKHAPEKRSQDVSQAEVVILDHKYFKIAYNPSKRLAQYVTYQLTAENLRNKTASRANKFITDPILQQKKLPYVVTAEYTKSGFDRGHLAPSADFAWSQEANDLTFVMSNMAPQSPNLNRDAWKRLEDKVRKWACGEEMVTVITGPVFSNGLNKLKSGLEIPQEFFKIVIDETPPKKIISFLYHQDDKGNVLEKNIIGINSIENATGIAFAKDFPQLIGEKIRKPASVDTWKEEDCNQ